jgi:hypothetical protein
MDWWMPILGLAIGAISLLQLVAWAALAIRRAKFERRLFEFNQARMRRQLEIAEGSEAVRHLGRWQGYRKFLVQRTRVEARHCVSLELIPEDGRPLPVFLPGQHVALRLAVPGQKHPVVRCYSLSDAPSPDHFRITARLVGPPRDRPTLRAGIASTFINEHVGIGDRVELQAPAGAFYLDLNDRRPAVLLAGGIGITPFMAMLQTLAQHKIKREVLLVYGVRNSEEHVFREELGRVTAAAPQIKVVTCYSQPMARDQLGRDFQVAGRISLPLIRQMVPSSHVPFYLCGPPQFMRQLFAGLGEWGVPESLIHFEAFGPATVRPEKPAVAEVGRETRVTFARSGVETAWTPDVGTLLELAERYDVDLASGCRAGNCGTCQVRVLSGRATDPEARAHAECDLGFVLTCASRPASDLVLDA